MRVILLAAGFGSRLRPLTNLIPKCLVPIKNKPLLEIWLERLDEAGFGPFLINTHYLANLVKDFIENSQFREKVTLVYESELLGTAGTLKANLGFLKGQDCLLIHADNYCLADFTAFEKEHRNRPSQCLMTMMTFRTHNPSSCGVVELDENGVVIAFHEKVANPPNNLANGAIYILSSELLSRFGQDLFFVKDFSTEVLSQLMGRIYTYETSEVFIDIGTPESYALSNKN